MEKESNIITPTFNQVRDKLALVTLVKCPINCRAVSLKKPDGGLYLIYFDDGAYRLPIEQTWPTGDTEALVDLEIWSADRGWARMAVTDAREPLGFRFLDKDTTSITLGRFLQKIAGALVAGAFVAAAFWLLWQFLKLCFFIVETTFDFINSLV